MTHVIVLGFCCFALSFASFSQEGATPQIAPDHAQLEGIFLSLFQKDNTEWALVKVTSVNGYGSGFRGALSANDTIEVKLPKTHTFSTGNIFSGQIKQGLSALMSSASPTYEIN